ncbi:MAG: hypothetical protein AAGF85_11685 [Bacteroidota bacterium]
MKKALIISLFLSFCTGLFAQKAEVDTVRVQGRSFIVLGDSSMYVPNDTLLVLPDSVASRMVLDKGKRPEEFYIKLKNSFYKRRFTKELYDLLFKDPEKKKKNTQKKPGAPVYSLEQFEGQRIAKVSIKKLEIFGTSINDTTKRSSKWVVRASNKLHSYTRSKVVRNNLFFKEGDKVDQDLITDSERIIRSLPFVRDSRIYLKPTSKPGEVEAIVVVKDLWSISFDAGFSGFDDWDVAITERNFLGLGHEVRNEIDYDEMNNQLWGYSGTYRINSIKNTFITADFNFVSSELLDRTRFRVFREFITPETKYAGGIQLLRQREILERIDPDEVIRFDSEFNNQDFWLGRAYLINENGDKRGNLQIAGRYSRTRFLKRPEIVDENTNQFFIDNDLYLMSVGYSTRSYEKSSLIQGFGRTEDIPEGVLYEATFGREYNEFNERNYLGFKVALGRYFGRLGYLRPQIAFGGFDRDGRFEQGMLNLSANYFSNLYRLRRTNFRQFFSFDFTRGIRRFDDEFITINDSDGIRGLNNVFLRGTNRLNLSSETVAFTPLYVIGFRLAIYSFIDLALINDQDDRLFKNTLYQGYGIGFRFRNENLTFNTIQIRLAWYPNVPPDVSHFDYDISGTTTFGIPDFRVVEPQVLDFR